MLPRRIGNWSLTSPPAAAREDGRTTGETRPLLLAAVGGEPSDSAAVRSDVAKDGGSHDPRRVELQGSSEPMTLPEKQLCVVESKQVVYYQLPEGQKTNSGW